MNNTTDTTYDFSDKPAGEWWETAKEFVEKTWPQAKHEGMGYWRIPRIAHIYYGIGQVVYRPMGK